MKIVGGILSALGAIALVVLGVALQTPYRTARENTSSYWPLVSWIPDWVRQIIAQPIVLVGVSLVLGFLLGRWSARRGVSSSVTAAANQRSVVDIGIELLNLAEATRYGNFRDQQAELTARINMVRQDVKRLGITFLTGEQLQSGQFDKQGYFRTIGTYLSNDQVQLARDHSRTLVEGVGRFVPG